MEAINPALAFALMPRDNFTQRRADDQQMIQQQAMLTAISQQQADQQAKLVRAARLSFDTAIAADVLQPDRVRLSTTYVRPWKEKFYNSLKNEYQGRVRQFMQEKGEWMLGQMSDELASSPELQTAQTNKLNYASFLKDRQDGKVLRGDPDATLGQFWAGQSPTLDYAGGYDRPKYDPMSFTKTPKPGYAYGMIDQQGRRIAPNVNFDEQKGAIVGTGTSAEDAEDWLIKKGNYNPALTWGMEDPLKLDKFALDQQEFANRRAQQNFDNGIQSAQLRLQKQEAKRKAAKDAREAAGGNGTEGSSYRPIIYGQTGNPLNGADGKPLVAAGQPVVYQDVSDPKVQSVVVGLTGAKARVKTTPGKTAAGAPAKAVDSPVLSPSGQPIYEVPVQRLHDANRPDLSFGVVGGKAKVYSIESGRIIKLRVPSEKGTVGGYSSWVKAKTQTADGVEHEVLIPVDASATAQKELDSQVILSPKKENQKVGDQDGGEVPTIPLRAPGNSPYANPNTPYGF